MRFTNVAVAIILLPVVTFAWAEPPPNSKADNTPALLEVPVIGIIDVN